MSFVAITEVELPKLRLATAISTRYSTCGTLPTMNRFGLLYNIAFVSERAGAGDKVAIFVMNIDGSEPKLLVGTGYDSEPAWSPDSKRIVFVSARDGNLDIYVMNVDGSNQVRLTNDPANESEPAWSPDGTKIVFVSDRDGNSDQPPSALVRSDTSQELALK